MINLCGGGRKWDGREKRRGRTDLNEKITWWRQWKRGGGSGSRAAKGANMPGKPSPCFSSSFGAYYIGVAKSSSVFFHMMVLVEFSCL